MNHETARALTFRGGGWVLLVAALLCAGILAWALLGVLAGDRPRGDGSDPATYGFDLSSLRTDGGALVATGNPRGFLPPLDDPALLAAHAVAATNERERIKHVVSGDRVIGVVIGDQARAYPLPIMNAHEVCNDTLGGVPIAVTYGPLCDSVVVFDRRIGGGGADTPHVARFAASGLLLDSNLVMEDLDEPGTGHGGARSLWSQLGARAISGPAARGDATLRALPGVQLVTWARWRERHPTTTVLRRDPDSIRRIKQIDYARYWQAGRTLFPVWRGAGSPSADATPTMAPIVAVTVGGRTLAERLDELFDAEAHPGPAGVVTRRIGDTDIGFEPDRPTRTVWVDAPPEAIILHLRSFAWRAFFGSPAAPAAGDPSPSS